MYFNNTVSAFIAFALFLNLVSITQVTAKTDLNNGQKADSTLIYPFHFTYNGNPLVRNHGAADPDVHVWDDTVWLYCSQDHQPGPGQSNYDPMDGYHAFSSTDMIHWTDHGEILHSRDVSWGVDGLMWAPGAARKNGIYYLYYPHVDKEGEWRIGIATSNKPEGPFTDIGKPLDGISGIDPAIFFDDNGDAYIYNNSAIVAKLKPNMIELAEPPRKIDYDHTQQVADEYLEGFCEGSYLHKRNGIYYYSYSNWHNKDNQSFYAMGDNPYGPFVWKGPLAPIPQGAQDHHSVIEFKGQWYYFYHIAVPDIPKDKKGQGRITCYDRLYYNSDGTIEPVVHTYGSTNQLKLSTSNGSVMFDPKGRSYTQGTAVTLLAKGDLGFGFNEWSGDLAGSVNPMTITMDTEKNVIATFKAVPVYHLSINSTNGNVLLDPPGGKYNSGDVVTLTPVDDFGYDFGSYSGDLNGSQMPATIIMNSDKDVTANFVAIPTYSLSINAPNGSIELDPAGGIYEEGTTVSILAKRDFAYGFEKWSGHLNGTNNPASVKMNKDMKITANFQYVGGGKVVFATNCGGEAFKSTEGINYSADTNFNGGGSFASKSEIAGTNDDVLYLSERVGKEFEYTIPLPNGIYEVTLQFAEIFFSSENARVFNVEIEGEMLYKELDIWSKSNKNSACDLTKTINVSDGELNIYFTSIKENAKVSAIKVIQPEK